MAPALHGNAHSGFREAGPPHELLELPGEVQRAHEGAHHRSRRPHAGMHVALRHHDGQLRHRLSERGNGHGPPERSPPGCRAFPWQVRRSEDERGPRAFRSAHCGNPGEGTGLDYFPIEVPALPSFRLHALVAEEIVKKEQDYRTGVVYTTNRRVWEHDEQFKEYLIRMRAIAIDMETATLFLVGHANEIPRGALLLVSDVPVIPEGVKTEEMDRAVTAQFSDLHLEIGIATMESLKQSGEKVKHLRY